MPGYSETTNATEINKGLLGVNKCYLTKGQYGRRKLFPDRYLYFSSALVVLSNFGCLWINSVGMGAATNEAEYRFPAPRLYISFGQSF